MRTLVALLVLTALAGCTQIESEATIIIEFSGQNRGVHDLETRVLFDEGDRPSHDDYEGRDVAHPDAYTVHDLLVDWNGAHAVGLNYFDGLGYALDSLFGVHSDFQGACWFWSVLINGEPAMTGISTTPVQDGDVVTFRYTNCWQEPSESRLVFDFDGERPEIQIDLAYDRVSAPSAPEYEGRDVNHPGNFTVHDLMTQWGGYNQLNLTYFDGLGYAVQGVLGVEGAFDEETCRFWALSINGVASDVGMSVALVRDGDEVVWTYTDCS
ncbi:MAG: DUF4430 domain-containing protein [Thermoplasmatota archaeon]